jgi:hypothetical protein
MKRIDIYYGGEHYSVGGRRLDDLLREVEAGLAKGFFWLEVNDGEGMMRPAQLLITPGVPLAVIPIPGDDAVPPSEVAGPGQDPRTAG